MAAAVSRVDDFHADRETDAADVDDRGVGAHDLADGGDQRIADADDPLEHALVLEDVEHGERRHGRHRVPAERAEEHRLVAEPCGDLAPGDDRADRVAVAHRLADRHDIGHEPEVLERPHVVAGAAVPALDLVGDPQGTGCVRRGRATPRRGWDPGRDSRRS